MLTKIKYSVLLAVVLVMFPLNVFAESKEKPWWQLNPMEIICNNALFPGFQITACTMVLVSFVVDSPGNPAPEIPGKIMPAFHDEMGDDGFYCIGGCLGDYEIHFNEINTFNCPNDEGISVYFSGEGYKGYLGASSDLVYKVTANFTAVYISRWIINDLPIMGNPRYYSATLYCKTPSN